MVKEKNNEGIVEATLFIAGRFLTKDDIVMYTGINPLTLEDTLKKLEDKYADSPGALNLISRNGLYKMDIKQEFSWLTNKLASGSAEFTKAEQETLAIIAYKQPINQSLLVRIRGNKAYDHVKRLIDVGLVKGKRVGHTKELRLDDTFYNYFSLKNKERMQEEGKKITETSKGESETSNEKAETSNEEAETQEEPMPRTNMVETVSVENENLEKGQEFGDASLESTQ